MQAQRGHTTHSSLAVLPGCQQPAVTPPPVMVLKDYFLEKLNGHIQKCLPGLSLGGFSTERQKATGTTEEVGSGNLMGTQGASNECKSCSEI